MIHKLFNALLDWACPAINVKPRASQYDQGVAYAREQIKAKGRRGRAELGNWIDAARMFGDWNDFDKGIQDVLREPRK